MVEEDDIFVYEDKAWISQVGCCKRPYFYVGLLSYCEMAKD